jgi:hypothetical protein
MLVIRKEQMAAFSRDLWVRFEWQALAHVRRCFPDHVRTLGEEDTMLRVQDGLRRAQNHGFESEHDLLRFLNVMFVLGVDFDSAEEYSWTREILESRASSPSCRMDELMEEIYTRFLPSQAVDEAPVDESTAANEFDGIVWEDDYDANAPPQSIVPEITPYERGPHPSDGVFPTKV